MELVKKTEQISAADRLEHARVLMGKARSLQMRAMYPGAIELLRKALQVVEEEYSLWDVAWVLVGAGPQRALFAKTDFERREGLAESLRAVSLFEDLGDLRWQMEACYVAGLTFSYCLLEDEGLMFLAKVIEIDEKNKFGDYLRQIYSLTTSARSFLNSDNFEKSLVFSQKALKLLEKTDSGVAHGMVYSNLTIEYALLGDFEKSEEYFDKLMMLPSEILSNVLVQVALPKAVFFAVKNHYKESNQLFEERLESFKQYGMPTALGFVLRIKLIYSWALKKQGRTKKAETLLKERQEAFHEAEKKFEHASLQAHLLVHRQVTVGKDIEMRLDLVNVGKKPCLLERITKTLHEDFQVKNLPNWCSLNGNEIDLKKKEIRPFEVITAKLTLKILKAGVFILNPQAIYVDNLGNTKTSKLQSITVTANPPIPKEKTVGKISSGTSEIDQLLLGGIPEHYAVVLTGSPSDERELIIKNFLEAGTKEDEITFFVSTEAIGLENLLDDPNFILFLCNPKPKSKVPDLPTVYKLRSKTDLTNLSISLAKAFRNIEPSKNKRVCIEIVSDVLLEYGAKATRKWISELITDLSSKGFTTLTVINPLMHSSEDLHAILDLFDGEIELALTGDPLECKKSIRVKKLRNQDFNKNPICLTKTT
jgi:KaiC/GvpD/RAD55 family RecA-like ATPase/tetratricopeptide (TPR) repeat protein